MAGLRKGWTSLTAVLLAAAATVAAAPQVDEARLKAAYVFNFAAFTTWPNTGAHRETLSICNQSQLDDGLRRALRGLNGKRVQNRVVQVQALGAVRDVDACDIVVLGIDGLAGDPALRAALAGKSVLTICDCAEGGSGGEVVRLVRADGKLRFEIDRAAAAAAGLSLSSKLLKLARNVE